MQAEELQQKNKRLAMKLGVVVLGMCGFAFALIPLYEVFCEVTGFNGKTGDQVVLDEGGDSLDVDKSRPIIVQFLSVNNESTLRFEPKQRSVTVYPGEVKEVFYLATNLSDREIITQSVPSVSPLEAADHMKKMECFCFEQQTIAAGETAEMPLRFYLEKELPKGISKLSLNYTIFDITEPSEDEALAEVDHSMH